jgi:hypothetical protein
MIFAPIWIWCCYVRFWEWFYNTVDDRSTGDRISGLDARYILILVLLRLSFLKMLLGPTYICVIKTLYLNANSYCFHLYIFLSVVRCQFCLNSCAATNGIRFPSSGAIYRWSANCAPCSERRGFQVDFDPEMADGSSVVNPTNGS